MAGIRFIQQLERTKAILDNMGLRMTTPRHGGFRDRDVVALVPKDTESLPAFSREAEIFVGDITEVESWLTGVLWARTYDRVTFGNNHDKNRVKKEQNIRHKRMIEILKQDDTKVVDK